MGKKVEYKVFEGTLKEWEEAAQAFQEANNHGLISKFYEKFGKIPGRKLKQISRKGESKRWKQRDEAIDKKASKLRSKNVKGTNPAIERQIERLDLADKLSEQVRDGKLTKAEFKKQLNDLFLKHRAEWRASGSGGDDPLDKVLKDEYLNLDPTKPNWWPEGKSKQGFLKWQGSVYSQAQEEANAWAHKHNYKTHAGHARAAKLGGPNARTNLTPEAAAGNTSKQHKGVERADWELDEAGISRTKTHAFQEYLMEGTSPKVRNFSDYSVLVRRILANETDIPIDQAMSIAEDELIQKGPATRSLTKETQKNIGPLKDTTESIGDIQTRKIGDAAPPSKVSKAGQIAADIAKHGGTFAKAATGLGAAEATVMLASGQVIPGTLAIAMQTPAVQKKIAGLLAKQGLKLIPGLSFGSGVIQGAGYALSGQPAKALLSVAGGAIGEIPGIGDAAQAAIDLGLTVSDVKQARKAKADKPEIVEIKKKKNNLRLPGADDINSRNIVRSVTKAI